MKSRAIKYKAELIGIALGAIVGWCDWYLIGCSSGSCAITLSPVNSSLYGAFMGGILGGMFNTKDNKKQNT